jgi:hypothetical protein
VALAIEVGPKELKEACLPKKGIMKPRGDEANGGLPDEYLGPIGYAELNGRVATGDRLRSAGQRDRTLFGAG